MDPSLRFWVEVRAGATWISIIVVAVGSLYITYRFLRIVNRIPRWAEPSIDNGDAGSVISATPMTAADSSPMQAQVPLSIPPVASLADDLPGSAMAAVSVSPSSRRTDDGAGVFSSASSDGRCLLPAQTLWQEKFVRIAPFSLAMARVVLCVDSLATALILRQFLFWVARLFWETTRLKEPRPPGELRNCV